MKVLIQRVKYAKVEIMGKIHSEISPGLLVFVGFKLGDKLSDADYLVKKIINLRIFEDENKKMNLNINSFNGEVLVVSQFTLYGDCKRGNRPDFTNASPPQIALP